MGQLTAEIISRAGSGWLASMKIEICDSFERETRKGWKAWKPSEEVRERGGA